MDLASGTKREMNLAPSFRILGIRRFSILLPVPKAAFTLSYRTSLYSLKTVSFRRSLDKLTSKEDIRISSHYAKKGFGRMQGSAFTGKRLAGNEVAFSMEDN